MLKQVDIEVKIGAQLFPLKIYDVGNDINAS